MWTYLFTFLPSSTPGRREEAAQPGEGDRGDQGGLQHSPSALRQPHPRRGVPEIRGDSAGQQHRDVPEGGAAEALGGNALLAAPFAGVLRGDREEVLRDHAPHLLSDLRGVLGGVFDWLIA